MKTLDLIAAAVCIAVIALLILAKAVGGTTPRPPLHAIPAAGQSEVPFDPRVQLGSSEPDLGTGTTAPHLVASDVAVSRRAATPTLVADGIASTYGPGFDGLTAARDWPRGSVLRICGMAACVTRTVNDYGPAKWTGRLLDLDVPTFELVSGMPWRMGLTAVTVTVERLGR